MAWTWCFFGAKIMSLKVVIITNSMICYQNYPKIDTCDQSWHAITNKCKDRTQSILLIHKNTRISHSKASCGVSPVTIWTSHLFFTFLLHPCLAVDPAGSAQLLAVLFYLFVRGLLVITRDGWMLLSGELLGDAGNIPATHLPGEWSSGRIEAPGWVWTSLLDVWW